MFFPHVVEPALGGTRLLLAVLCDAYREEVVPGASGDNTSRVVLGLHEEVAPFRAAVGAWGCRGVGVGGGGVGVHDARACYQACTAVAP